MKRANNSESVKEKKMDNYQHKYQDKKDINSIYNDKGHEERYNTNNYIKNEISPKKNRSSNVGSQYMPIKNNKKSKEKTNDKNIDYQEIVKDIDKITESAPDKKKEIIEEDGEKQMPVKEKEKKKGFRLRFRKNKKGKKEEEEKEYILEEDVFKKIEKDKKEAQKDTPEEVELEEVEVQEEIEKPKEKEPSKIKFDQSGIEIVSTYHEPEEENPESEVEILDKEIEEGAIAFEKKGFGWKGLGARKIIYDEKIKEYIYNVIEPKLSAEEKEIKDKIIYFFRVRADIDVFTIDDEQKKADLEKALDKIVQENHFKLTDEAEDRIFYYVFQEFMGYGRIDILMHDYGIEDISCDGINVPIFVYHKDYESIRTNIIFKDSDELDSFIVKLSQMCGKQISVYEPIVDGKLEDGSRLQTTLSRTITRYSTFTIRRFREDPLTPIDLIENNTMSLEMAAYFWMAIEKGTSILFCGGTAAGKTTALNALSLFLPSTFKIVSIEDTREINLPHENWIAGTTRTGFTSSEITKTGKDIDMFDLIKVALRQRPKVIIVGEVRGKEAYTLFQAMTTGHLSYSTIHASDMHTLIQRLENKPIELPRALLTSLDLIIFLNSVTVDGAPCRRITNVTEVIKLDPESNRLVTLTPFHWMSEIDDRFEKTGGSRILNKIKMQYGWDDKRLKEEIENRKKILIWMMNNNHRSYHDVGKIVSEYVKNPKNVLKMVKDDKK